MFQSLARQFQQLWSGGEVPVCLARVDVAEIGRQQRKPHSRIAVITKAVHDGADSESMPQVMQPRPARGRARLDAGSADYLVKGRLDVGVEQPGARGGDEQRRHIRWLMGSVTSAQILTESGHGAR